MRNRYYRLKYANMGVVAFMGLNMKRKRPDSCGRKRVRSLALSLEKIDDCADRCRPDCVGRTAK